MQMRYVYKRLAKPTHTWRNRLVFYRLPLEVQLLQHKSVGDHIYVDISVSKSDLPHRACESPSSILHRSCKNDQRIVSIS